MKVQTSANERTYFITAKEKNKTQNYRQSITVINMEALDFWPECYL